MNPLKGGVYVGQTYDRSWSESGEGGNSGCSPYLEGGAPTKYLLSHDFAGNGKMFLRQGKGVYDPMGSCQEKGSMSR